MSTENIFFLLIFVALPLFEWLSRVIRERQAEQRRRGTPGLEGEVPPVERPRRPRPVETRPPDRPVSIEPPPARVPPPRPRTVRPTAAPVPASVSRPVVPTPAPRPAPPAAAVVTTRSSSWRRLDQLGLRGRPALRRALVARTILGPCAASRPHEVGTDV